MRQKIFDFAIAPLGLVTAFWLVEGQIEARPFVVLASYLSGLSLGLYFSLLLWKQRRSG